MIDKLLESQKQKTDENTEIVNTNGRALDSNLAFDKEAREYTKKIYRKCFDKKK